jgi:nucleoid DNA-binding protein
MSKQQIVKRVQEKLDMGEDGQQVENVLDAVFQVIGDLNEDQSCRIRDFGVFKVKQRKARKATPPPRKGSAERVEIEIPAHLAMTFKISKKFKERINPTAAPATKAKAKKTAAKKKKKAKKSKS